jgi:GST-like protein
MTKKPGSAPSSFTLFGARGCGNAAIEALLELADVRHERVEAAPWEASPGSERLRALNPLGQVPTLVVDDGTVITESAAMVLWLAGQHAALAPAAPTARAELHRWVVFLATNVYAALGVGDHPELWLPAADDAARAALKAGADERVQNAWTILERGVARHAGPFLLGDALTALDVYAAMLARWRPGREWLATSCPRVAAATARAEAHPVVARVWARHFA